MTVIQPIFYGGNSDIKLKSLTPQYNEFTLTNKQVVDFTITPEFDLSKTNLYTVSCDAPHVTVIHLHDNTWRMLRTEKEDTSYSETVKVHIRANDDSGVSLDVPLVLQASNFEDDKTMYVEPKTPTADYEPTNGWKPFEHYGSSPAEIIANCVRNKDYSALHVGDYFTEIVKDVVYRWTIVEFNHYGRGEALMVPDKYLPTGQQYSYDKSNLYRSSIIESKCANFYNAMPATLKPYVLNMRLPWTDKDGSTRYLNEHVFPPSEIEAFGKTIYSKESYSTYKQWACFTDDVTRQRGTIDVIRGAYWLRSTEADKEQNAVYVKYDGSYGSAYAENNFGVLPCFCIG